MCYYFVDLKDKLTQLQSSASTDVGGKFVWVDSILVRALQQGHWLLVDNVNFCRYKGNTVHLNVRVFHVKKSNSLNEYLTYMFFLDLNCT